jgi:hypothetical protein
LKTIWKYELQAQEREILLMPIGAQILSVQTQRNTPCIWALVDPSVQKESRVFRIVGTGHDVPWPVDRSLHRGTVQVGPFVWHIFEENPPL